MTIFKGRPDSASGRTEREIRVYDLLDALKIEYIRADHAEANTMSACSGIDELLGVSICKNLFLCNRQKTDFYLLMMPADKPFRTKELSSQLGVSRLSFADPDDMLRLLDIRPGAVSIMGLMNDRECVVRLVVDREVLEHEYIGCHPCVSTSSLKLKTGDVFGKFTDAVKHSYVTVDLTGISE